MWQDIETAPVEETVLIFIPARTIQRINGPDVYGPFMFVAAQDERHGWTRPMVYCDSDLESDDIPTHWMALPKPPQAQP